MQVTTNVVQLPAVVIDAYLDILSASVGPILKEESLPAKAQHNLLWSASRAAEKSVCMKFIKEIEEAGLFSGVVSIDYPGFKWTRGMKYMYAVEMLVASMVYSIALAMPTNNRDLTNYLDYLEAWHSISVDRIVGENLEGAEGPAVRRLEEHALGLATANVSLLIGETSANILRVLNNVKAAMEAGSDTPLASVDADMEYLMASPTIYL